MSYTPHGCSACEQRWRGRGPAIQEGWKGAEGGSHRQSGRLKGTVEDRRSSPAALILILISEVELCSDPRQDQKDLRIHKRRSR